MREPAPARVCVVVTTPLIVRFFLTRHIVELSRRFDTTLVANTESDTYAPPPSLPVRVEKVQIARKIAPWRDLKALAHLICLFARERFDAVYAVTPKAGLLAMTAAALTGTPLRVHTFQGEVWAHRRGFMRHLLKTMDRITARAATHLLAVSHSEREFLEREGVTRPGSVTVLGRGSIGGVDLQRFAPDPAARSTVRAELAIPEGQVVCAYVGRLTVDKGVLDLARAFATLRAECPGLWLLLVGPDEDNLRPRIEAICGGERLVFAGYTERPQRYMAAADMLCLPSYREGFGMVIIEAAAVGIPAVGSRVYGITDAVVEGETGLLFAPGDVADLTHKLRRLVASPELRTTLGRNAMERVKRDFSQAMVVDAFIRFFENLVASAGRAKRGSRGK